MNSKIFFLKNAKHQQDNLPHRPAVIEAKEWMDKIEVLDWQQEHYIKW